MEYKEPTSKRSTKKEKDKRNKEYMGGFSQKHVRLAEALREKASIKKIKCGDGDDV